MKKINYIILLFLSIYILLGCKKSSTTIPKIVKKDSIVAIDDPIKWKSGMNIGTSVDMLTLKPFETWRGRPCTGTTVNAAYLSLSNLSTFQGRTGLSLWSNEPITNIAWASGIMTITFSDAHFMQSGYTFSITNANPSSYNGNYTVASVVNSNQLTTSKLTDPGTYISSAKFGGYFDGWPELKKFKGMLMMQVGPVGSGTISQTDYIPLMVKASTGGMYNEWRAIGNSFKEEGRDSTNTIIWLGHEFNGTWYPWNPGTIGNEVWVNMYRQISDAFYSSGCTALLGWGFASIKTRGINKDISCDDAWDLWPGISTLTGKPYARIVMVDQYDFWQWYPIGKNWKALRNTPDIDATHPYGQNIVGAMDFCKVNKVKLGIGEWSIVQSGSGPTAVKGNPDDPDFIQMFYNLFTDPENAGVLLYESVFLNYAAGQEKYIYPTSMQDQNVNASALYKSLWSKK